MRSAQIWFERGILAHENGQLETALSFYEEALKLDPKHPTCWMMRGMLEHRMGRNFNAAMHVEAALTLDPRKYDGWCNLGVISACLGLYDQSEKCFLRSLELMDTVEAHVNLGDLYLRQGKRRESAEQFRHALRLDPKHNTARGNLGQMLKGLGQWKEGFQLLQGRFTASYPPRPLTKYPLWRGEDLTGKRILLFPDAGSGDEILALRFAPALAEKYGADTVVLETRPELYHLAKALPNVRVILQHDDPPVDVDYAFACGDLPLYLDIGPDSVPSARGYLPLPAVQKKPGKFVVGLCWQSGKRPLQSWTDRLYKAKSLQLSWIEPLIQEGVDYISLQLDTTDDIAKYGISDGMERVENFSDTAHIIAATDLVISVDTSVAHLAGALGKPVWNFVAYDNVWPFGDEVKSTIWYDSMTIYRQPRINDWAEPIARAAHDLATLRRARAA